MSYERLPNQSQMNNKPVRMLRKGRYSTGRAVGFLNHINEELINKHAGQSVHYFKIDFERTDNYEDEYSDVYQETSNPRFSRPFYVPCLVNVLEKTQTQQNTAETGHNTEFSIEVYFQREILKKYNLSPSLGDVISFQRRFFEINNFDDSPMAFGTPFYHYSIKVTANMISRDKYKDLLEPDVYEEIDYIYPETEELP